MKRGGVTTANRRQAIAKGELRRLRNDVPIGVVVEGLGIEWRQRRGRIELRCPECRGFCAAIHQRTNLARCFRCARNYNPIDLVMAARRASFLEAVEELLAIERATPPTASRRAGEQSST